jgi:hypothetical protein
VKTVRIVIVIVLVAIVALAGYLTYAFYFQPIAGNSCVPYLRTNCGGGNNVITYDKSTGDITVPNVGQSFGTTWYNVAVTYSPGDPNMVPTSSFFVADPSDFSGNMLTSGQTVTVHSLNATGPAVAGQMYNGSLWIAYTTTSGGQSCAGAYRAVAGCQYSQIGTITLQG